MNRRFFAQANKRRIPGSFNRAGALLVLGLLAFATFVGVFSAIRPAPTSAAASTTLTFQARLLNTSGSLVADGTYNVEFKIYDTVGSGASTQGVCSLNSSTDDCWWLETRTGANKVTVKNGYVYANLGSVTAFSSTIPWDQELWITMNIGGTGAPSWDGEMSPRFKVAAVPYAFAAAKLQVTDTAITNKLIFATPSASNKTITLPNETGTVCTTGSICSGYASTAGYATISLNNIASTNLSAALNVTSGNLSLQTTTSGNINLTPAVGTGLVNVLTGNLQVGNGVPGVTLNGEDLYVEGTLEVDGAQQFDGALVATSTAAFNGGLTIGDAVGDTVTINSGAWTFANDTTIALTGGVNGLNFDSNTLSIDATNDRVGIGTATPRGKLDVGGASDVASASYFGYGSATLAPLRIVNTRWANYGDGLIGKNIGGVTGSDNYITAQTSAAAGYSGMEFRYGGDVAIYGASGATTQDAVVTPSARLFVQGSSGSVGIGTTAPGVALDVVGEIQASSNLKLGTGAGGGSLISTGGPIYIKPATSNGQIFFHGGGAQSEFARFNTSGSLGIGDTTPAAMLTVGNGDLFQVNSSGAIAASTGIANSGGYVQSGATANTFTGAGTFSAAGTGLTVSNNALISGDIAVNGGDITSTASTFNLLNSTVSTLNIGGASTTLTLGATTGTTKINNALRVGDYRVERSLTQSFTDGVADQKFDLYFSQFWGELEITLTSGYSIQNASGSVKKTFFLGLNPSNAIYTNTSRYSESSGATPDNFAISDVTWDATNLRYRIQIVHRVSTGNSVRVGIRALAATTTDANEIANNMTTSAVYTTDTTAFSKPVVSFTNDVNLTSGTLQTAGTIRLTNAGVLQNVTNADASTFFTGGALTVARGGTGASTFTTNGVLYGNTTGALQVTAASTGANQCLITSGIGTAPIWGSCTAGGGVTTMAAIGAVPNANGATISTNTLTLQPADASFGGVVTTGTQTFAGAKTFNSTLTVDPGSGSSNATINLTGRNAGVGATASIFANQLGGISLSPAVTSQYIGLNLNPTSGANTQIGGNAAIGYAVNTAVTAPNGLVVSGNVGIGVTNPSQKLTVDGIVRTQGSSGGFEAMSRDGSGTNFQWYNPTGDDFRLYGGADFLAVTAAGNVGIGTTTIGTNNRLIVNAYSTVDNLATAQINTNAATNKGLVVQGFTAQSADLLQTQNSAGTVLAKITSTGLVSTTPSSGKAFEAVGAFSDTANQSFYAQNVAGTSDAFLSARAGDGVVGTTKNQPFYIITNSSVKISIGGTGKVGLGGNTSATSQLDIQNGVSAATIGTIIKGFAAQSANLVQLQDSAGTILTAFDSAGKLVFGPSGAQDTNLYRSSADVLKTDDTFYAAGNILANQGGAGVVAIGARGPSAEAGIQFGSALDTNLYRSAADTLKTDDALTVNGLFTGVLGATISGATTSINASSNFATNINTGTSNGAISIGNSAAGVITLQSASTIGLTGTSTITGLSAGAGTALTVNNSTSTGSIFVAQDNATAVLTVADGGAATFRNSVNSTTALQVQNSAGTTNVLTVDTTNVRVGIGTATPDARLDVEGSAGTELVRLSNTTTSDSSGVFSGSGSPEGVVTAQIGSLYTDTTYGKVYKKGSGDGTNTGWDEFAAGSGANIAKMTRAAAQSIPNATPTKIAFDTEEYDVGGIADPTTNDRFNILKSGKYLISAGARFINLDEAEYGAVYIYKNGTNVREAFARGPGPGANNSNVYPIVTDVFDLAVGDYIEMYVAHSSGASQDTYTGVSERPGMTVSQIDSAGGGNPEVGVKVYNDANQNVLHGTPTALTFNQERYDTSAMHSTSSNTSRLVAPTMGKYLIVCNASWSAHATGVRELGIRLNGGNMIAMVDDIPGTASYVFRQTVTALYQLAAGDYVECVEYQDSGTTLTISSSANHSPEFAMSKIDGGVNSTLQAAYNSGNTLTTTDARDVSISLADTATDSNFILNVATGSTSKFGVQYNGVDTFSISNAASAQGSALFKNATNNTTAFMIQNSTGTPLVTVDTTNKKLTVATDVIATAAATATTATTSGTGTNTTTLTFSGTTSFANNDILLIDNAGQDYYTRIVSGANAASVTVSPAVTFETARTVTKYTAQNIGATVADYATNANKFFQGYFLGGVVTGAGSTTLSDGNLSSSGNLVLQSTSGNVGIGATNPQGKLHLASLQSSNPNNLIIEGYVADGAARTNSSYIRQQFDTNASYGSYWKSVRGANGATYEGNLGVRAAGSDVDVLTWRSDGNVGIGTTAPTGKLQVASLHANGIFQDVNDRPSIGITGHYPQMVLMAGGSSNASHGATLSLGSYDAGTSGAAKRWSIGTAGNGATFLDFGYSTDLNPHGGIRNYSGTTMMTILNSGNVGIGAIGPTQKLEVAGNGLFNAATSKVYFGGTSKHVGAGRNNDLSLVNNAGSTWLRIGSTAGISFWGGSGADTDDAYDVHIGTTGNVTLAQSITSTKNASMSPRWDTAFYVLQSQHWYGHDGSQEMYVGESNVVNVRGSLKFGKAVGQCLGRGVSDDSWLRLTVADCYSAYSDLAIDNLWAAGALRFDIAEFTPVKQSDKLIPGDIVSADPDTNTQLRRSQVAYDRTAMGIVSSIHSAAMVIGGKGPEHYTQGNESELPIALGGRVLVKVSSENGLIERGDAITTSSIAGTGMKITQSGPIIGKSMDEFDPSLLTCTPTASAATAPWKPFEDPATNPNGIPKNECFVLPDGTYLSRITVFVTPSWYNPDQQLLAELNVSGLSTLTSLTVTGAATFEGSLTVLGDAQFQGNLKVLGDTEVANITVNGKIITAGNTPTVVLGATTTGDGSSYTIEGNDTAGSITITTGTPTLPNPLAAGEQAVMTFVTPFTTTPRITLTPTTEAAANIKYFVTKSGTEFKLHFTEAPQPNTIYSFDYQVIQ